MRTLKKIDADLWNPRLQVSTASDAEIKAREAEEFKLMCKAELDEAMKRKREYANNMHKACTKIWERCNKILKALIEARTDYDSTICNDSVELLKAIKEYVLNYQESRCDMAITSDAFRAFFNCKQHKEESLQDYTKCFKVSKEILESHLDL